MSSSITFAFADSVQFFKYVEKRKLPEWASLAVKGSNEKLGELLGIPPSTLQLITTMYNALITCPMTMDYLYDLYMNSLHADFGFRKINSAAFRSLPDDQKLKALKMVEAGKLVSKGMVLIYGNCLARLKVPC